MTGPILIYPLDGRVYQAKSERGLVARGDSPEQALANLRAETERWLDERWAALTAPPGPHPWLASDGGLAEDDPVFQDWRQAVEDYRRENDAEPAAPDAGAA